MATDNGPRRYRAQPGLASLPKSKPIPLINHRRLNFIRDTTKPYQYLVEVRTRNKRTREEITRYITIVDRKPVAPNDILSDAADAIMNSPVASREEPIGTKLIRASRYPV